MSVRMHPKDCKKPGMVGLGNKHIRNFVKDMELETHDVKIRRCKEIVNKESMVLGRNGLQKSYRNVVYKVGCADIPIAKIIKALEKKDLRNSRGIYLEDVDFTIDYSGSFNKEEIIDHLLSIGYKLQNSVTTMEESIGTIMDNNYAVGKNCVSFLQSIGGCTIRSKIYDKMVQMLESKGVQDFIGNHWKNWIIQKDTRLAKSRDKSVQRGLTRLEATLYCGDNLDEDLIEEFQDFVENLYTLFPKHLIYDTPHQAKWKALTETFKHSLVIYNKTEDKGVVVYNHNELTKKTSGIPVKKMFKKLLWCLGNLTLSPNLPIEVITFGWETKDGEGDTKDIKLDIEYTRLQKVSKNPDVDLPTRVVDSKSVFSYTKDFNMEDAIKKSGFTKQPNCTPIVSTKACNVKSKVNWDFYPLFSKEEDKQQLVEVPDLFYKRESLNIKKILEISLKDTKQYLPSLSKARMEKQKNIRKQEERKIEIKNNISKQTRNFLKLPIGKTYKVQGTKMVRNKFYPGGYKDIFLLENGKTYWGNKTTTDYMDAVYPERILGDINYVGGKILLTRTGTSTRNNGRHAYAILKLRKEKQKEIKQPNEKPKSLKTFPPEEMRIWKELVELVEFPIHTVLYPEGMYKLKRHNKDNLVIACQDKHYIAGLDLESKIQNLKFGCGIRLGKTRVNNITRRKYVETTIFQNKEWWYLIPLDKIPVTKKVNYVDVVSIKTGNRDVVLLLMENGTICKLHGKTKLYKELVQSLVPIIME